MARLKFGPFSLRGFGAGTAVSERKTCCHRQVHRKGSRGQTAIEYLTVFTAALMIIAFATIARMIDPGKVAAEDSLYLSQGRAAADTVAQAIDLVYVNGPGAVRSVSVSISTNWRVYLDNAEGLVRISVSTSNGWKDLESNLRYPLDNYHELTSISRGVYTVIVQWPTVEAQEDLDGSALKNHKLYINLAPREAG